MAWWWQVGRRPADVMLYGLGCVCTQRLANATFQTLAHGLYTVCATTLDCVCGFSFTKDREEKPRTRPQTHGTLHARIHVRVAVARDKSRRVVCAVLRYTVGLFNKRQTQQKKAR